MVTLAARPLLPASRQSQSAFKRWLLEGYVKEIEGLSLPKTPSAVNH
jgi:hypothetical protein